MTPLVSRPYTQHMHGINAGRAAPSTEAAAVRETRIKAMRLYSGTLTSVGWAATCARTSWMMRSFGFETPTSSSGGAKSAAATAETA